ncbi:MAG TPA: hypothetical protein VEG38_01400 [Acidimicrobiia bacterium]|nr:hypothetical protein [Acidimicrobiia bacterium]
MRQRTVGNVLVLFGVVVLALGFMAGQATATDQGPNYQDKVVNISGSRSYDAATNRTTFVFNAQFSEPVSHLVVVSCPESPTNVVDAGAPSGVTVEKNKNDPSTGHTGTKFEKAGGTPSGTYTVVLSGNVTGAEFVVKNGNGHKHYRLGTGCSANSEVSTSSSATTATTAPAETTTTTAAASTTTTAPAETTTTTAPAATTTTVPAETTTTTAPAATTTTVPAETTTTTVPAETTTTTAPDDDTTTTTEPPTTTTTGLLPDILGETTTTTAESTTTSAPATTATTGAPDSSTTSSTIDSSVLGSQLERPSQPLQPAPSVEGATETAPDAAIANTGSNTGDYLLLAGLALVLGGLAVRFGQADGATGN